MALPTTETYISVEDAIEYAELMGLDLPEDEAELENLLRRSAIYLDRIYGPRYVSEKKNPNQYLEWPRYGYTTIPVQLGYAQVELASLVFDTNGTLPSTNPSIKKTVIKLEGIESSIEYADAAGYAVNPYDDIDSILYAWLILPSSGKVTPRITMTRGA